MIGKIQHRSKHKRIGIPDYRMNVRKAPHLIKLVLLFIVIIASLTSIVSAQEYANYTIKSPEKHIVLVPTAGLEVAHLDNWAPDYLTVTNTFDGLLFHNVPESLTILCVITEINGQSTKGMSEDSFCDILLNSTEIELRYLKKENGQNVEYKEKLSKPLGVGLVEWWGGNIGYYFLQSESAQLLVDEDVDFFEINSFDFLIDSSIMLEQKQLLKVFAGEMEKKGLKRSKDNPDILLYVTMQNEKNIENVWHPLYVTKATTRNRSIRYTTQDRGYMSTDVSTDIYHEMTIINAKKTDSQSAPVICQMKDKDREDGSFTLNYFIGMTYAAARLYPFGRNTEYCYKKRIGRDGTVDNNTNYFYGIYFYKGAVSFIKPNSFASRCGIKIGDLLETRGGKVKRNSVLLLVDDKHYQIIDRIGSVNIKSSTLKNPTDLIKQDYIGPLHLK